MLAEEVDILIEQYFHLGLQQREMLLFLSSRGADLSSRDLKRRLRRLRLFRRKEYSPLQEVTAFVNQQLLSSARLHGYKWMHLKCLQSGFCVTQNTVRNLLSSIDPVGVSQRRRKRLQRRQYFNKGPNYLWHVDGYDKLKPYGICISGCIDGFSRKILWLKASPTNNDPKVIAGFYIKTIRALNGFPHCIRSDMGNENVYMEQMQKYFHVTSRNDGNVFENSLPPVLYGTSPANQRIESWWSILRKHNSQFWINIFEQLKEDGQFTGTSLDKSILQYCFMDIIQEELKVVATEWNYYKIRRSRNSISPSGKPEILYTYPEVYSARNYSFPTAYEHIRNCEEECLFLDRSCSDQDIFDLCEIISAEMNIPKSYDVFSAVSCYSCLRTEIIALLGI